MKAFCSIYCLLLLTCLAGPLQAQNTAPTDITLTPGSVAEIANYNQTIGTLAAVDANTGDTHTFTLVSGTGSTDNAVFAISGSSLRLNGGQVLDFEAKSSYAIRVQADDGQGGVFSKALTVTVINRNEYPTFLLGADQSVTNVYNTAQSVTGFATGIGDGDSTVTQTLTFTTTVLSGAEIFAVAPSVSLAGVLTYTPNGTSGTATIEVRLTDDATINGDAALSVVDTFTISSNYTAGAPIGGTVNLNSGGTVQSIGIQRDGACVVGGTFTTALGTARSNIARLNANHTLDTSFDPKANGAVTAVVVQPDGKILIGGAFTTLQPNGAATATTRNRIARLNADGTLDTGFNPNSGGAVNAMSLLDDGRILIGGAFTTLQPNAAPTATTRNRIAMLNADGTLDTSFNPNANNTIHSIVQQVDGRLLIGGVFTTLQPNGAATATTRNRIARLNADGTLDTSFNPNANGTVQVIAVQPDDKIVLGGAFTSLQPNGAATATTRNRIARLSTDGSLDTTFDPNVSTAASSVFCIALQAGGGMMIGGDFTTVASTTRNRVARITATGTLDTTETGFNPNANNTVHAIACLESSDLMLLGGLFTTLTPASTALTRTGLALIYSPGSSISAFWESSSSQITYTRGGSSTVLQSVSMELSTDGRTTWAPLGSATRLTGTTDKWRITGLSLPTAFDVRARSRAAGGLGNGSGSQIETVGSVDLSTLPTIANPTLSQPTATSAIVGADVTSDGSTPILERGIVYALTLHASQPSLQTFRTGKITASGTTGPFNVTIPNLSRGSGYSFRAYVTNKNGTVYSSTVSTASSISATTVDRGTGGITGQSPSLAVVNGCPAMSYYDVTDGNLKYARNSAPDGTGTWSITTVFSENGSGFYSALAVINGYPAIAYSAGSIVNSSRTLEVHYIRANDVDGTSWGQPVKIETYTGGSTVGISIGLAMNLIAVDGNPAIAYIWSDADLINAVYFWRAGDAVGSTWTRYGTFGMGVPPTAASLSLAIVDGNPALCYNDSGLKYRRATNAQGTAWGTAVTVSATAADGVYCSLQVINGNPAISHYNSSTRDLKYSRATNTTGTGTGAWSTPITLDSTGDVGSYTTLLTMDGKPAISYHDTTNTNLKLIRATTANGATTGEWAGAAVLDSIAGDLGKYARMAMVNGLPAIAYHDATGGDLKFIQATDAAGSAWAAPSVVDAGVESGDVGRNSSQCIVNGSPAIAYHDATNGSIRYVRATPLNNAWSVPIEVATGAATGLSNGAPSLWVVNGMPAITYANAVTGRIQYVRALDADGTSWGSPVDVTTSAYALNTFQATTLRVVAGRPCVIFQDYTTQQLIFVRAADMGGNAWNPAQVLAAAYYTLNAASLAEVNGRAAVTYAEPLGPLQYMRAADADATSWNAPVPISTAGLASSLAIVQGHPAISFSGSSGVSYVRADDVDGTIWPAPITISSVKALHTSLAVIDGQPAIAYCDNSINTSQYYTRAASATGSLAEDWSTPVNLSATKSILTVRRTAASYCSLIDFNGDAAISYYDSFEDNLVWVHYAVRFTVEQPVTTALVSGSTSRSLGNVSIGSSSSPLAFTLRNTGGVPLSFLAATKDGANPGDFTLDTSATAPLIEGGAAQTIRVTFTPSGTGVRTAVLHLLTDDPVTPRFDITLTGTGVSTGNAAPTDITLSSSILAENNTPGATVGTLAAVDADVGDTHVFTLVAGAGSTDNAAFLITGNQLKLAASANFEGQSSYSIRIRATDSAMEWTEKAFTIAVLNVNELPAFLKGADQTLPYGTTSTQTIPGWATAISDGDSTVAQALTFTVIETGSSGLFTTPAAVAPDGTLTFTPNGASGTATFTIVLTDDASINGGLALTTAPQTFTITVNAAGPDIAVFNGASTAAVDERMDNTGIFAIGSINIGSSSTPRLFTIQNTGNSALNLGLVTLSGGDAAEFSLTQPGITTLASQATTTISITFSPTGSGSRSTTIQIPSDDADENPFRIIVSGTGNLPNTPPAINSDGGGITASISVPENTTAVTTVTANDADVPAQTLTFSKSGADEALFTLHPTTGVLTWVSAPDFETRAGPFLVTVNVTDNGNPALSDSQALTILVTNVNEPPSFTKGANQVLPTGTNTIQTVTGWATAIDDGDDTVVQSLSFNVSVSSGSSLFTTPPAITSDGTLQYTPNGTAGTATVSVTLTDDAILGAALTTAPQVFTITVPGSPLTGIIPVFLGATGSTGGGTGQGIIDAPDATASASIGKWESIRTGAVLSSNGSIAFRGFVETGTGNPPVTANDFQGIWKFDGTDTRLKARTGSAAPDSSGALFDMLPLNPSISPAGLISFYGSLRMATGNPPVNGSTNQGLWSELGGGTVRLLLRKGDPVINGKTFRSGFAVSTSNVNTAALNVRLSNGTAMLHLDANTPALGLTVVAEEGQTAPGGGTWVALDGNSSDPRLSASGDLGFIGWELVGSSLVQGIYSRLRTTTVGDSGATVEARAGGTAPGTGGSTFSAFERPTVYDGGIAFRGFLNQNGDNAAGTKGQGVWAGSFGSMLPVVRTGDTTAQIPTIPAGSTVTSVWSPFSNVLGSITMRIGLSNVSETRAIIGSTGGAMQVIAKVGDAAPGLAGETFTNFDHPVIGDGDQIAFTASTNAGSYGIWKQASGGGALSLVMKVGDTISTSEGDKVVSQISLPGATTDDRKFESRCMDASGRLLIHVSFPDGSTSLLLGQ